MQLTQIKELFYFISYLRHLRLSAVKFLGSLNTLNEIYL
jgi:hypothetical protein